MPRQSLNIFRLEPRVRGAAIGENYHVVLRADVRDALENEFANMRKSKLLAYCTDNDADPPAGLRVAELRQWMADEFERTDDVFTEHEMAAPDGVVSGRLFVQTKVPREPAWATFLDPGFGDLNLKPNQSTAAILAVTIDVDDVKQHFAFTFGSGRYLLDRNAYDPTAGLKVALNAMYKGVDSESLSRVLSVNTTTLDATTFRTRKQANRDATFDDFGVDLGRDLLSAITGAPNDTAYWGTRVSGSASLRTNMIKEFDELGTLCRKVSVAGDATDYKTRFDWVDNIQPVTAPHLVSKLEEELSSELARVGGLSADELESERIDLAPSENIDWSAIAVFGFSPWSRQTYDDLDLANFIAALKKNNALDKLADLDALRDRHLVKARDDAGKFIHEWRIFDCLDCEFAVNGMTYVLVNGLFYEISKDYMQLLDDDVGRVNKRRDLMSFDKAGAPRSGKERYDEGAYNRDLANSSNDYLNLDAKTIRVPEATSDIEICDVFTSDRVFVHVKRKLRSSMLSHLFAQGSVSGDLFRRSAPFRTKMLAKIEAELTALQADGVTDSEAVRASFGPWLEYFNPEEPVVASDYEVVYAIAAKWGDRFAVDALPFFSKVNLRTHAQRLNSYGFRVSYARIPEIDSTPDEA